MILEAFGSMKPASMADLFSGHDEIEREIVQAKTARTRLRIQTRRANSEATLAEILPGVFENGDSYHVISGGNIDSLSYLQHMLKAQSLRYVLMSTWCMAGEDVAMIEGWLTSGKISRMDCYCGEIFPSQYAQIHADLCRVMHKFGGRVCIFRNHSKVFAGIGDSGAFAIESSANVNTNPRTEQTAIHMSADLFLHYKEFFDGIKSFTKDFEEWKPWQET